MSEKNIKANIVEIEKLVIDALQIEGEHHKQWYLERILECLGYDIDWVSELYDFEKGIAP